MKKIYLIIFFIASFVTVQSQTLLQSSLSGCSTTSTITPSSCSFYVSPSGNYTWTTNGVFTDTIPNAAGCDSIITIDLTINPAPIVMLGPDVSICQGESILLNAAGGFGVSYTWSTGETTQNIIVSLAGVYSVTVQDMNGCTGTDDISVTVNPVPLPNLGPDVSICQGESVVLDAGGIPGGMYLWSTGETTQSINAFNGGVYTVTVVNMNGCSGSDDVTVTIIPLPAPGILPSYTICQGQSVVLDALGPLVSYLWSTGATTQTITVTTAGAYTVTVTNASGCTGTGTTIVTVNPNPTPIISGNTTICQGYCTILNAGSGYTSYIWMTSNTTPTLNACTAGNYWVIVTDANGCSGSDTITVTVNPNTFPVITGDSTLCPGQNTVLDPGVVGTTYLWNTGATTQILSVNTIGTYTVTVTQANGCTGFDSFTISAALPYPTTLTVVGTLDICQGDSVKLIEPITMNSYQWYKNNTLLSGAITSSIWISTPGMYKCLSTDLNNCPAESNQLRVRIVCFPPPPPIERIMESGDSDLLQVFPNPSSGVFNLELDGDNDALLNFTVTNVVGQVIFDREFFGSQAGIDLSAFPNGVYVLHATDGKNSDYIRLVKFD